MLTACLVPALRLELERLELEQGGVKRELVARLLEAQSSGHVLAIRPVAKKKRAQPKKKGATRDVNTVPTQAGWAWIEFSDGEANWFHLRASHFGDDTNNNERRGAWRRGLAADRGMGACWVGGNEATCSEGIGSAAGRGSEEVIVEEIEVEIGPDDERENPLDAPSSSSEDDAIMDDADDEGDGDYVE